MSEIGHNKPMITVEQQVARLKAKGVTFDLCTEEDAARILAKENNYLRVTSYRKLYERQEEGSDVGVYVSTSTSETSRHTRRLIGGSARRSWR